MHITTLTATIALVIGWGQNNHVHLNGMHTYMEVKMIDITRQEAEQIAISELKRINEKDGCDWSVDKTKTEEYPFGWAIKIFPKKYFETTIPDWELVGIGFFIVIRNGDIVYVPDSVSPDTAINWFTKAWKDIQNGILPK